MILRVHQTLIRELNLPSPTIKPGLLVSKFITQLNLTHNVEILAHKILDKYAKTFTLSGKNLKARCGGYLYCGNS